MATPQETRFARLAVSRKVLTRDQMKTCLDYQKQKRSQGSNITLWDCAVLNNMLDETVAEGLQDEAGDLAVEKLGEFTIMRKLGEGGMGSVWLCRGPSKELAALKVLPVHLAKQRPFLTRFFREAQASIKLQHPNIVRGMAVDEDRGNYYFAMEFVDGISVRKMIDDQGPLPPDKATDIIRQAAEGLAYAHEAGIVHRDIKPDNIMVAKDGVVKLADLGLARQVDAEMTALTRTGTGMGTPFYMAPEQGTDAKRADARSDIYSLGATWYHMVTGQVPFTGATPLEIMTKHLRQPAKSPRAVRSDVPRSVSMLIERMLAKKPESRVQSAGELCKLIDEHCLGDRDVAKELGLQKRKIAESFWDMQVAAGRGVEKRRFDLTEVRQRIRRGQVTRDTPTRRAGTHDAYQPAGSFRELQREFPHDYAVSSAYATKPEVGTARAELHTLVAGFDKAKRGYSRRRTAKRLAPLLIQAAIVLAIIVAAVIFWPKISGLISGLLSKSPPPE